MQFSARTELLNRTLIWNEAHLRHALREYERHYNEHRIHRSLAAAAPSRARHQPLGPDRIERFAVLRRTVSVESCTSIGMPLDLCGRNFRHAQRCRAVPVAAAATLGVQSRGITTRGWNSSDGVVNCGGTPSSGTAG
jgi:hypothetical protein